MDIGALRVNKILPTICCCKDIVNQNECVTCCIKCKVITKITKKKVRSCQGSQAVIALRAINTAYKACARN